MLDIGLFFNQERLEFDFVLQSDGQNSDIEGDNGLFTAVVISLFTDARANNDDPLPDERIGVPSDLRGWWGDHVQGDDFLAVDGRMGSRLWLLSREKDLDEVVARAQQYAEESLAWLLRDGHVTRLEVVASRVSSGYLGIAVTAMGAADNGDISREWNFTYDYQNARPVGINGHRLGLAA